MKKIILLVLVLAAPVLAHSEFESYAASCAAQVAPIPPINCADGALVPITINGQPPASYSPDMACDNPALLPNGAGSDGQCVPGSRVIDLSTPTAQITVMCRQKNIRSPIDALLFNEIDVIAHNPATGATCWFQAEAAAGTSIDGRNVPSPNAPRAEAFWNPVSDIVTADCGGCHDNDPIMYSPFIAQVWDQIATNPLGLYFHIEPQMGFDKWPTLAFAPRDNTCLACHRIGVQETCGNLLDQAIGAVPVEGADSEASTFPGNTFMPPEHGLTQLAWQSIYQGSVARLQSCCENPAQAMCNLGQIPGLPAGE